MKTTDIQVVVSQVFNKPIEKVWSAITNRMHMVQWYFDNIPEFSPEVGFKTQFNVEAPSRDFLHLWEVTEVIPGERLVYNWKFENTKGAFHTIWELEETNEITSLTLTIVVTEDFDDAIPEFKRESCLGGWNFFIKERLTAYLKEND